MVTLQPLPESPEFYEGIEKEIIRIFYREIYRPLVAQFSDKRLLNVAPDPLVSALLAGKVTYNRGVFSGQFSAGVTKRLREYGARWDRHGACFRLSKNDMPEELATLVSVTRQAFERKLRAIDEQLAQVSPEAIAEKLKTEKFFDSSLFEMDRRVQKSLKKAGKVLSIGPRLTDHERRAIATDWQSNMDIWIKDFTKKEIRELRTNLMQSILRGNRYESAIRTIQKSYEVTRNKAKFLASQETRLMLCKFKAARYESAGVKYYKWKSVTGSAKHPVRPRHRELNNESDRGKLFRFDQPPITTGPREPARRNNPGEDYNCRCVAVPVVDFRTP